MSPAPSPPQPASRRQGSGLCAVFQRVAPADTMLADDTITVTRQPREKPFSFFSFLSPPPFFETLFSRSRIKRGRSSRFFRFRDFSRSLPRTYGRRLIGFSRRIIGRISYEEGGMDGEYTERSIRCNVMFSVLDRSAEESTCKRHRRKIPCSEILVTRLSRETKGVALRSCWSGGG